MKKISHYTTKLIIILTLGVMNPGISAHTLPDLGSEHRATLSISDEKLIGESWMRQIRASGMVYPDPIVNEYVQYLGNKLTPYVEMPYSDIRIKFFAVNDPSINAFAFFGGHIAVNSGLILISKSESELAGVMAHELGHVSQQHVLRQITESNRMLPITLAQSLAAALLGVPELIIPVMAGHGQRMLNFSRQNEQEADRVGMKILSQANFDPHGLPNIFESMSMQHRYESKPPEYLLTHPLYDSRIADTRNRANSLNYVQKANSNMFYLIKARLEVQNTNNIQQLLSVYENKLKTKRHANELNIRYGYAYALLQAGKHKESWQALNPLLQEYPDDLILQMTAANLESEQNNNTAAQARLENILRVYPDQASVSIQYIELLLLTKQAKKAKQVLIAFKKAHVLEPIYFELARHAEGMLGNQTGVYEANAEWYLLNDDFASALMQLEMAAQVKTNDQLTNNRIQTRIKEIAKIMNSTRTI